MGEEKLGWWANVTDSVMEVMNTLWCLQIKLWRVGSSGLLMLLYKLCISCVPGPQCTLEEDETGYFRDVLNAVYVQRMHLVQNPRDMKAQRPWKRWPVIFFCVCVYVQLPLPRPLQPAEPLMPRVWSVCEAWHGQGTMQWTWKAPQTLWHTCLLTQTYIHTHFLLQPLLFWS